MALKAHTLFYDFVLFPLGSLFLSLIGTTVKFQGTLIQYREQLNSVTGSVYTEVSSSVPSFGVKCAKLPP